MMRRGRGKAKKLTSNNNEDAGSGEEEKLPAQKKRGRPQKVLKDEIDLQESRKVVKEDSGDEKLGTPSIDTKNNTSLDYEKKRKKYSPLKDGLDPPKEVSQKAITDDSRSEDPIKLNGFRHNGSRRKSTPRRAAEVGIECR